jgi:hypothetical protein
VAKREEKREWWGFGIESERKERNTVICNRDREQQDENGGDRIET